MVLKERAPMNINNSLSFVILVSVNKVYTNVILTAVLKVTETPIS